MNPLPKGWTLTRYPGQLEIRDEKGVTQVWIPVPNTPMTIGELLEKANLPKKVKLTQTDER